MQPSTTLKHSSAALCAIPVHILIREVLLQGTQGPGSTQKGQCSQTAQQGVAGCPYCGACIGHARTPMLKQPGRPGVAASQCSATRRGSSASFSATLSLGPCACVCAMAMGDQAPLGYSPSANCPQPRFAWGHAPAHAGPQWLRP